MDSRDLTDSREHVMQSMKREFSQNINITYTMRAVTYANEFRKKALLRQHQHIRTSLKQIVYMDIKIFGNYQDKR